MKKILSILIIGIILLCGAFSAASVGQTNITKVNSGNILEPNEEYGKITGRILTEAGGVCLSLVCMEVDYDGGSGTWWLDSYDKTDGSFVLSVESRFSGQTIQLKAKKWGVGFFESEAQDVTIPEDFAGKVINLDNVFYLTERESITKTINTPFLLNFFGKYLNIFQRIRTILGP